MTNILRHFRFRIHSTTKVSFFLNFMYLYYPIYVNIIEKINIYILLRICMSFGIPKSSRYRDDLGPYTQIIKTKYRKEGFLDPVLKLSQLYCSEN